MKLMRFIKEWALIWAMVGGVVCYFTYVSIPWLDNSHRAVSRLISIAQPGLIFAMLLLTFCRIEPRELRLRRWHGWLLAIQGGMFCGLGALVAGMPQCALRIVIEGAMICMICPTATAAAVITRKLGGDVNSITAYTILANMLAAILLPAVVPFIHAQEGMTLWNSSMLILAKVFPLLLLPLAIAMLLKGFAPKAHAVLGSHQELSFYLWIVALALAIGVSTREVVHSTVGPGVQLSLAGVSAACCVMQFRAGRKIGAHYGMTTTAGQALGQKNTVLAIWVGYTFFTPVTAVVGGFYSIWHNVINSWQLHVATSRKKQ